MGGLTTAGRYIFAISLGAFGVQYLVYAHSAPDLINIPPYTVSQPLAAYLVGICLVIVTLSWPAGRKL